MKVQDNPAAFQVIPRITVKKYLYNAKKYFLRREAKGLWNYSISSLFNFIDQSSKMTRFYCNCCASEIPYLVHKSDRLRISWNSSCPRCSSRKRHRGLTKLYLEQVKSSPDLEILHFAPEPVFYNVLQKFNYSSTDLLLEDVDFPKVDIQKTAFQSGSYDLVLCNHVLEHVENDDLAIAELSRICKMDGQVIITVPGNWQRKQNIYFKNLTLNGHYRDYGHEFVEQLKESFREVEIVDLYSFNLTYKFPLGLNHNEDLAFICKK